MIGAEYRSDYYVYAYFRPDGSPCYIGKGRGGRWKDHLYKKGKSSPRLRNIIAKAGGEIPHVKLHVGLTNEQAIAYEVALIAAIGRGRNGPLVNLTNGGEGASGVSMSAETRAKLRAVSLGRKRSPEAKMLAGRDVTGRGAEHMAKMVSAASAARRGKPLSPEVRAKISATKKGRAKPPVSPETRAKMSAWQVGKTFTPEHRAKLSAARLGKKYSPETIARMCAAQTRRQAERKQRIETPLGRIGKSV